MQCLAMGISQQPRPAVSSTNVPAADQLQSDDWLEDVSDESILTLLDGWVDSPPLPAQAPDDAMAASDPLSELGEEELEEIMGVLKESDMQTASPPATSEREMMVRCLHDGKQPTIESAPPPHSHAGPHVAASLPSALRRRPQQQPPPSQYERGAQGGPFQGLPLPFRGRYSWRPVSSCVHLLWLLA